MMNKIFSASLIASICIASDEMGPSVVAEKHALSFDRDNRAAYQADWAKLYNFSTVDFFKTE